MSNISVILKAWNMPGELKWKHVEGTKGYVLPYVMIEGV